MPTSQPLALAATHVHEHPLFSCQTVVGPSTSRSPFVAKSRRFPRPLARRAALVALAASANIALLAACHSPPVTLPASQSPETTSAAAVTSTTNANEPPSIWKLSGLRARDAAPGPLDILLALDIQLITEKTEPVLGPQAVAAPPSLIGVATETVGLGKRVIRFSPGAPERIAREAADIVTRELVAAGFRLLGDNPTEAADYARFATSDSITSGLGQQLTLLAADTGKTRALLTLAPPPYRVITAPTGAERIAIERDLMQAVGADRVLSLTLRLGVYNGRLSLESDSALAITTRTDAGVVRATRALISASPVHADADFALLQGDIINVDTDRYLAALRASLPAFLQGAVAATR